MGEGADRAGDGAGADLFAGRDEPRARAGELGIGEASLSPNVVGSAWTPWLRPTVSGVLVLEGARLQRRQQRVDVGDEQVGRLARAAR